MYGKTMENLRTRIDVKLLSNEKGYFTTTNIWQWSSLNTLKQSHLNTSQTSICLDLHIRLR